jgi:hypothetical protein
VGEDGHERRAQQPVAAEVDSERVAVHVLHVLGVEQVAEAVVEAGDREDDRDAEGAEGLDERAVASDAAHDLRPDDVRCRLERQQDERDQEDGQM